MTALFMPVSPAKMAEQWTDRGAISDGPKKWLLNVYPDSTMGRGILGVILVHAQASLQSTFSTLFCTISTVASGYQYTSVAIC